MAIVSCSPKHVNLIPSSGKVSYEIVYSDNLLKDETIGQFLPHNATGVYNKNGIKLTATAPFGFVKATLVYSPDDFYATVDIDKAKFIVSFNDFRQVLRDSIESGNGMVVSGRQKIANYMSEHYSKMFADDDGNVVCIDLFCIPLGDDSCAGQVTSKALNSISKSKDISFLITGLSLTYGESNVLFLINDLKGVEDLPLDEFERQSCYVETSVKDLIALSKLMDK